MKIIANARNIVIMFLLFASTSCGRNSYDKTLTGKIDGIVAAFDSLSSSYTYKSIEHVNRDGSMLLLMAAYDAERPVMLRNMFCETPYREHQYYLSPQTGQLILVKDITGRDENNYIETRYYYDNKKYIVTLLNNRKYSGSHDFLSDYAEVEESCREMLQLIVDDGQLIVDDSQLDID